MKQSRSKFIKHLFIGVTSAPLLIEACGKDVDAPGSSNTGENVDGCVVTPEETAGPYPYDLSGNGAMFRSDITEGRAGIPLALTLTVVNTNNNCNAVENARVDIWHCDKDGYYSEYNNPGYLGTQNNTSKTFLRGIQLTDNNGEVKFTTIYPGWYTGRITHIHVEVFIDNVLKKTTQVAFPDDVNETIYKTSLYSSHGQNSSVAGNAADMVFGDSGEDLDHEICTITANATTGGYDATHTIGIAV